MPRRAPATQPGCAVPGRALARLVALLAATAGCAAPLGQGGAGDAGCDGDCSGARDGAPGADASAAMPGPDCHVDADCQSPGVVCFHGQCIFDPCATDAGAALAC